MKKEILRPTNVYKPVVDTYSHAVKVGNMIYAAGTGPFDDDGKVIKGDIKVQTRQLLENFKKILAAGGATLEDVIQCSVYIASFDDYQGYNDVYREYFPKDPPTRVTVEVSAMYGGMLIELGAIALVP